MNPVVIPLLVVGLHQMAVMSAEQEQRYHKYELAREYVDSVGKPLLVVGGPYGSTGLRRMFNLPAHGFGDYCLDLDCLACDGGGEYVQADIRHIPFPDNFFGAAFVSHVLEHLHTVHDCVDAVNELNRVADVVLVAYPTPDDVIAVLHPDHYLWLQQEGNTLYVHQKRNPS